MSELSSDSGWLRAASRRLLKLGTVRATLLLTLVVLVVALVIAHTIIGLAGRGDRVLGTIITSVCALVLTPTVGSLVLRLACRLEEARLRLSVLATQDDL